MYTLSLNGPWKLTYSDIGDASKKWGRLIDAAVPGDVHLDLMNAGLMPEPLVEANSLQINWVEEKDWWYKKVFSVSRELLREKVELIFEGIDLTSDIWLNGEKIGHTNNMFREYRFDVTDRIKEGDNVIDVRVDVGFEAVKDKPTENFENCWNTWDVRRFLMRKATQAFFWDITPRLLTCGIWRGVKLEAYDRAVIRDVYVEHKVTGKDADLTVNLEIEAFCECGDYTATAVIRDERTLESACRPLGKMGKGEKKDRLSLHVNDVSLWWPNGVGDPHLYEIEVRLADGAGTVISQKTLRYGVRDIEIEQKELNAEESTFTFVVNGKRVFCKGGNWVPADAVYARITPEREYELVKIAQRGNYNMFRMWGGGVYPDGSFFDACDEMGIMVWQDFMFACGYYPDYDREYCEDVAKEIEYIVRKYRNHASLGLWCGNNENMQMHDVKAAYFKTKHYGEKLYTQLMPELLKKLDPNNLYWPSSPYGGDQANSSERGDMHIWKYSMSWLSNGEDQLNIWGFSGEKAKFISEFGIEAPPNIGSAHKFMGSRPIDMTADEWNHHMCYFAFGLIENLQKKYYRDAPVEDLEEYTLSGQMIQAESIKDNLDAFRSRMYECSGTIYWQYNESWGHTGYAPVDYYRKPKASYYYMKRSFAPVCAVFKDDRKGIAVLNDTLDDLHVNIEYGIMDFEGNVLWKRDAAKTIPQTSSVTVGEITAEKPASPEKCFAYIVVRDGDRVIARNRKFLAGLKELCLPKEDIRVASGKIGENTWRVELSSDRFMWDVNLAEAEKVSFSDNAFDLWPNETKVVYAVSEDPQAGYVPHVLSVNHYLGGKEHE